MNDRHSYNSARPTRVAIVHYRDDASAGGSLRVGETIANNLDPRAVEAHLIFAYGGPPGPVAEKARVPCHFIDAKGPAHLPSWARARALFRELRPDLIHFQDAVNWLRLALIDSGIKTVLHVHGRYIPRYMRPRDKVLARAFIRSTDAQVCISEGARQTLLKLGWARAESTFVVYNSIDCARFGGRIDKEAARRRLRLPPDARLLGMVGRLFWAKGCADLLSLLERLPLAWHGVFCGDGPERTRLEQQCRARGLSPRVHFIDGQNEVAPVYASLDALAFLSRYEAFGMVLAEAMAAGIPIFGLGSEGEYRESYYPLVTTETACFVERRQGSNHDAEEAPEVLDELARRIADYGERPQNYAAMTERARDWVRARFDAPVQAEAVTRVYEEVCRSGMRAAQTVFKEDISTESRS
ncbi:MAG TPA: glycosyltransferase family 4 protein [Pyrinomonadaceae bacterium]|jgi:glycosyltransferase involved in cell wall biosynthesis|nr:glycosyltransferase family 4 protein [Pyrinomonadaceae bacterium]